MGPVFLRHLWALAGFTSVGLAIIGALLPILPTVPFLLLAAFCFARSDPRWANSKWGRRLLDHPHYGPALRRWRERRAIARKAKISALLAMTAGTGITWLTIGWPWVLFSLLTLFVAGSWIWTRPE